MFIRHSYTQSKNNVTLECFCNSHVEKDIIIRVGGVYYSVLEHCRKMKFRTYLHLTLISKIWKEEIFTLVYLHIPKKHVKINFKYPWLNNNLKKMFRKQKRLHRLYCKRRTLNAELNLYQSRKELKKV